MTTPMFQGKDDKPDGVTQLIPNQNLSQWSSDTDLHSEESLLFFSTPANSHLQLTPRLTGGCSKECRNRSWGKKKKSHQELTGSERCVICVLESDEMHHLPQPSLKLPLWDQRKSHNSTTDPKWEQGMSLTGMWMSLEGKEHHYAY